MRSTGEQEAAILDSAQRGAPAYLVTVSHAWGTPEAATRALDIT